MSRNCLIQLKTAEPTINEVETHFLLQPTFRFDAIQIANQKHLEHTDMVTVPQAKLESSGDFAFTQNFRRYQGYI